MSELALLAQWALAVVLAISGVAKLLDRQGTADALADFGVPARLARVAPLLPVAELGLAGALLVPVTARWGAVGALVLLAVFSLAIAANLLRGRRPDCNCFGRLGGGPIGARTLVRNGVLMGVALLGAIPDAATPRELVDGVNAPTAIAVAGAVALVVLVGALGWLVVQLWMQQGRLLLRIDALEAALGGAPAAGSGPAAHHHIGPPPGTTAPDVAGLDLDDQPVTLARHWSRATETLVVFGDPDCQACATLAPRLVEWQAEVGGRHVVVVTRPVPAPPHEGLAVVVEHERAASIAYGVRGTPSALLVDRDGRVLAPLAEGADAIRAVLASRERASAGHTVPVRLSPRPAATGDVVPDLGLERVPARSAASGSAGPGELLVFWNEGCGHCRGMTDALAARVDPTRGGTTGLTFVVGSPDQAQAVTDRFVTASALVDPSLRLSMALGVPGTPSAVLVDGERRLAADLGVGPDAVLSLVDLATTRTTAAT